MAVKKVDAVVTIIRELPEFTKILKWCLNHK